jgi:hypothetical protein
MPKPAVTAEDVRQIIIKFVRWADRPHYEDEWKLLTDVLDDVNDLMGLEDGDGYFQPKDSPAQTDTPPTERSDE